MKLKWFVIILILIQINIAYSETVGNENITVTFIMMPANQEGNDNITATYSFEPLANNEHNSFLTYWLQSISNIITTTSTGGSNAKTIYYDVILNVSKLKYSRKEIINFNITIINKGYVPDRDGILKYYLLSPSNKTYGFNQETQELIPPSCPEGAYDRYNDVCVINQNVNVTPKFNLKNYKFYIPGDAEYGEWKIKVEYNSQIQPLIPVEKPIYIEKNLIDYNLIIVIFILFAFFALMDYYTQKK